MFVGDCRESGGYYEDEKGGGEDLTAPDLRVKVSIGGCAFTADEIDLRVCINEMKSARAAMNE